MKTIFLRLLLIVLFHVSFQFFLSGQDSGIVFFEGNFEEALKEAANQDKTIFVDAYTTWCGPCKRMKRSVFPDKKVGEFYNKHFINMAIDMETQAGKTFNNKYKVTGYPSLLFINQEGEIVLRSVGAKDVTRFIALGESAIKADDRSDIYAKMYEAGNRDFEFMVKYIKSLNKADKPSAKIAYDFLEEDRTMTNEQKAVFIYEAATASDSRLFEMLTSRKYKNHAIKQFSEKEYNQKLYELCWNTVQKGIDFEVQELVDDAKNICKKEIKNLYPLFALETDLAVARKSRDADAYLKAAKKRVDLFENAEEVNDFLLEMVDLFPKNSAVNDFALKTAEKTLKTEDSLDNNYTLAQILISNKRYEDSFEYLNKALELALKEKKNRLARDISQMRKMAINRAKS